VWSSLRSWARRRRKEDHLFRQAQHNVGKHKKQEDERLLQARHGRWPRRRPPPAGNRNRLEVEAEFLERAKRTRDTMRAESTSTMSAVEPSLTSWYEPALWLTMTMKTSTLAAAGWAGPA